MTQPLVSIITSCYNHEKYLDDYFHGLLSQTYSNIELILYDDGSTDGSWKKIQSYERQLREKFTRVVCERHENMSARKELALAIQEARGEYLCWIDSDDYYLPTKIEENVTYLESHPEIGVVHSDFDVVREKEITEQYWKFLDRKIPQGDVLNSLLLDEFYVVPAAWCFRTQLIKKFYDCEEYMKKGYLMADAALALDLAKHTQFGYIDKSLARYRIVEGSMAHPKLPKKRLQFIKSGHQVKLDYIDKFRVSENVRQQVLKACHEDLYHLAYDNCLKEECLESYGWLLKNYSNEYGAYFHRISAFSTYSKPLWQVVKFCERKQIIYRVRQWFGSFVRKKNMTTV